MARRDERLCEEFANVPLARAGFDALTMSSPILVQMNPEGRWENTKPANLDEDSLRAAVQHLINADTVSAAQSFCCQCAADAKRESGQSNYVPVIMMPVLPASECPFDIDAEMDKVQDADTKPVQKSTKTVHQAVSGADKDKRKPKKRGFVMQRLTDFDLLSQW